MFSSGAFLLGALILEFYGISIPVLRVSGGLIVAGGGWKLLSDGSQKELDASADGVSRTNPLDHAFYPLTLPLTTGPGTIAVVISLGLSRASCTNSTDDLLFVIESFLAVVVIAITIFFCFAYADRVQRRSAPVAPISSAAFRVHSVLPWYPDTMVRWKRAVAIRDPFRVVSPPGLKALSANRLALNWSRYLYLCLRDSLTGTTPLPDVNGNAEHEHDRPIQHRLCAAPIEGEDSKDEGDHLDRA